MAGSARRHHPQSQGSLKKTSRPQQWPGHFHLSAKNLVRFNKKSRSEKRDTRTLKSSLDRDCADRRHGITGHRKNGRQKWTTNK